MTDTTPASPRLARRLIAWRFTGERREIVLGDLEEEFAEAIEAGIHPGHARRRYWRQALASVLAARPDHGPWSARHPATGSPTRAGALTMAREDVRYALRLMKRSPWWTLAVVGTIALAIGANTAVFSVVNAVMLRPLPFRQPDRLVWIAERNDRLHLPAFAASVLNYLSWKDQVRTLAPMGAFGSAAFSLTGAGEPEQFTGGALSASMFDLLGLQPVAGRSFVEADERPGAPGVVMIGDSLWRSRFGGDPTLIGRQLTLNGLPTTVIGIAPSALAWLSPGDIWKPLTINPGQEIRLNHAILAVGRVRSDTTLPRAQAELDAVAGRMSGQYPEMKDWGVRLVAFRDWFVNPQLRTALIMLLCAVGCVLLVAAANVANLLLARAEGRKGELALRTALGASRGRVLSQLVTETLVLAMVGGLVGTAAALFAIRSIGTVLPPNLLPVPEVGVDARVLGFALALTAITGIVFGLLPAWRASRASVTGTLNRMARGSTAGRTRVGRGLAALQLALATMLLIGAGLLTQSVLRVERVNLGFDPDRLLTFQLSLPPTRYPDIRGAVFYRDLLASLRATPGVKDAATSSGMPFGAGSYTTTPIATRGASPLPAGTAIPTAWRIVSPAFFRAMRIPLLRGREFEETDVRPSASVVIVSEQTARRFWADGEPLGRTLHRQGDQAEYTVIGVVGDVRESALEQESPSIYYPSSIISRWPVMDVAVRTDRDPMLVLAAVRQRVHDLDADLPLSTVRTMDDWIRNTAAPKRLNAMLMIAFAGVALVIAAIGIYGVLAYSVNQRTQEIGVRLALGAERSGVLRLFVGEGMAVGVAGVGAGLAAAFVSSRWLASLVYGVTVRDPWTYALVAVTLGLVALAASAVPARKATRVDPVVALRHE